MTKLLYKVDKQECKRNQVIIREGDSVKQVFIIEKGEFEMSSRFHQNREFHLELKEKLLGRNYLQKFLKPKKSYLSLLGVGQLMGEDDLLRGFNDSDTQNVGIGTMIAASSSSVTITCKSLSGKCNH